MMKLVLFVCAQALFVKSISAQCLGAAAPFVAAPYAAAAPLAAAPWGAAAPCGGIAAPWGAAPYAIASPGPAAAAASHGGGLPTASASAIPPNGVALVSENAYEGALAVAGAVPFLGTVGLEGALPTAGAGAVAYGCGNGEVAILSENIGAAAGPLGYAAGPLGYGAGPLGYGAGPLGYGFGYEAPIAAPGFARAGCGCGRAALI